MRVRAPPVEDPDMNNKLVWLGILVVLALTIVSVANCRRLPEPWDPRTGIHETESSPSTRS